MATKDVYAISLDLYAPLVKRFEDVFIPLQEDLRRAHMQVPVEQWAAFTMFVATLTAVPAFIFSIAFSIVSVGFTVAAVALGIIVGAATTCSAFVLTYYYPNIVVGERRKKIENALSFSTIYMSTIARSGFPPQEIFRLLAGFKEYGEVSKEAQKIANDVEALGLDVPSALTRAMNRSPSSDWTELLAGLKTTITVGGDLGNYLGEKASGFVADYRRRLQDFSNILTLLVEVYITLVVVGAIFFIVTTSVMVSIGGVPVELVKIVNYLIVLVGMPLITASFILIAKGVSPLED